MCQVTIYSCSRADCPLFTTCHIIYCEGARSKRTFTRGLKERVARFDQREGITIPSSEGCTGLEINPYSGSFLRLALKLPTHIGSTSIAQ
ncbi:hypothetical protein CEP54_010920 [Fusarium duplospermum]|uniref:Uncharacterized protein n=1 Tax=Fusarium duplospermum TaxID=1325734 RepID=A0A428PHK6_9HYPO|nr:hypothetical protein CEP54_010920 [Fusarium duplospermum]